MTANKHKSDQEKEDNEDDDSMMQNILNEAKLRRRELLKTSALAATTTGGASSLVSVGVEASEDPKFKQPEKVMIRQGYNNGGQLSTLKLGSATFQVRWSGLMIGDIIDLDLKLRRLTTRTRFLPDKLFNESNSFYESNFVPTDENKLLDVYGDDNTLISSEISAAYSSNDNDDIPCVDDENFDSGCELSDGTYYIKEDVSLSGDLTLNVSDGDIILAIDGDFDIGLNKVNVKGGYKENDDHVVKYYIDGKLQGDKDEDENEYGEITHNTDGSIVQNQLYVADSVDDDINIDGVILDGATGWETMGRTAVRVQKRNREDKYHPVEGRAFYPNGKNLDLADHSEINIEDLDVNLSQVNYDYRDYSIEENGSDLRNQNKWKRGVLYELKIDVTPPDQSTFTSQRFFLHTTVKAQLGTGIQFGNAFGVTEEHPDGNPENLTGDEKDDIEENDNLFYTVDKNHT